MNTALVTSSPVVSPTRGRGRAARTSTAVTYRSGVPSDARSLHDLIQANVDEGHLLPRQLDELLAHAHRFVVAMLRGRVVGGAELAPLGARVAEVRSLVVDRKARAHGIGRALLTELQRRARLEGYESLCAFTHDAGYFVRRGYSIVPHAWVPEKIAVDCLGCPKFRRCGQHAVVLPLVRGNERPSRSFVPLASLRG
jgi:amino-acid N-acetyltransferase